MKPVIITAIIGIFVFGVGLGFSLNVSAEEGLIPSWIKNTAGFWVDGQIGDAEFIGALQYLVKERILIIPNDDDPQDTPSKYEGLTEEQIRNVKIIEDSCALKIEEAEVTAGKAVADVVAKKCESTVMNKIEEYRNKNNS